MAAVVKEEPVQSVTEQKATMKAGIGKATSSSIKFGLDVEIEIALTHYCKDEFRLSKVYWPVAFRSLVIYILEAVLKKPEMWNYLSTDRFAVTEEHLRRLIEELKLTVSHYIKVSQRQWVVHLLREFSVFRRKYGLSARLPNFCSGKMGWPIDLEDKDDLSSSMTDMSLRDDVKGFLWKILDEIIPPKKYCNMHYFGAVNSLKKCLPIVIEVAEDYLENVKDRIETISHQLRSSKCENLLPIDLVEVKGVPVRDAIAPKEF